MQLQTRIYSPAGSINKDTGDTEQLERVSSTTDQDVSDGALYSRAGSIDRAPGDIEQLGYLGRTPAFFLLIIHEYTSSDSSVSSRDLCSFWNWTTCSHTSPSKLPRRIHRRTRIPRIPDDIFNHSLNIFLCKRFYFIIGCC